MNTLLKGWKATSKRFDVKVILWCVCASFARGAAAQTMALSHNDRVLAIRGA